MSKKWLYILGFVMLSVVAIFVIANDFVPSNTQLVIASILGMYTVGFAFAYPHNRLFNKAIVIAASLLIIPSITVMQATMWGWIFTLFVH